MILTELYLIVTLCAGTTSFYIDRSSYVAPARYTESFSGKKYVCEDSAYKLSAIETWYCKYFGHKESRRSVMIKGRFRDISTTTCKICDRTFMETDKNKPVQKTETEWVWE